MRNPTVHYVGNTCNICCMNPSNTIYVILMPYPYKPVLNKVNRV